MRDNGFDRAQRAYDNMTPEEDPCCPECGGDIITEGDLVKCYECDWSHDCYDYDEPDYE